MPPVIKIKWNEVTWYSKLLSALFIFGLFPAIVFFIGRQYEQTLAAIFRTENASYTSHL